MFFMDGFYRQHSNTLRSDECLTSTCFDSFTNAETERINHSATIKFAFYAYKRHQSIIFSLIPAVKTSKPRQKSRLQLRLEGIDRARQWKALIGTNGIETRADLARYLGISRAGVTQVLTKLENLKALQVCPS